MHGFIPHGHGTPIVAQYDARMGDIARSAVKLAKGDALVIVDVQNDFLHGGPLPVPRGDEVIYILNRYAARFAREGLPVFATRDWHPPNHCSFLEQGGPWPPHGVADSEGAQLAPALRLPSDTVIVSKGTDAGREAYSGFASSELAALLERKGVKRLFIGGLATDYCVLNTVVDALGCGFAVFLLVDAIRAVDVQPGDGDQAVAAMTSAGAVRLRLEELSG